jgi:hypothetical protein
MFLSYLNLFLHWIGYEIKSTNNDAEPYMTRREWPTTHAETRDTVAEEAQRGVFLTRDLITKNLNEVEKMKHYSLILDIFLTILRKLEGVGAKTRP